MQGVDSNVEANMRFIQCIGLSGKDFQIIHKLRYFFARFVTITITIFIKKNKKNGWEQQFPRYIKPVPFLVFALLWLITIFPTVCSTNPPSEKAGKGRISTGRTSLLSKLQGDGKCFKFLFIDLMRSLIYKFYSVYTFMVKFNILSFKGEFCSI